MARANKHFLVNLFRGKLTLVQPACGSFLSSFVRDIAESSCLFVFRQRFSAKIIYLSTVPSIDSPARGGGGARLPCTFSDTGPSQPRGWNEGFLECSEHNPLCPADCVYVCMRFQVEWNSASTEGVGPSLSIFLSLSVVRLNNSRITSTASFALPF